MNLERQKLLTVEINEEVAANEKLKTGIPEHGLKFLKRLEVLYLFENRLS